VFVYIAATVSSSVPRDRDHDRMPDSWERNHQLAPTIPSAGRDPDGDRLSNRHELRLRTHPRQADTDRDHLRDGAEVRRFHTNPRRRDTDGDGFRDRCELRKGTNPRKRRSRPKRRCSKSPQAPPRDLRPPTDLAPGPSGGPTTPTGGFPDASNTGPTGSLTPVPGNVALNTPGMVYANRDVSGCIDVNATNVTIRNVRVICNHDNPIWLNSGSNLLVEDTEYTCGIDPIGRAGIGDRDYTLRRVHAHGCENLAWANSNVLIEDSFFDVDVPYDPVRDPHTDALQIVGSNNVTVRHNRIYGDYRGPQLGQFGNAAITTAASGENNLLIENNLLAGGGYTLYCAERDDWTNYVVRNNRFSTVFTPKVGGWGPWVWCRAEDGGGNVYHETGKPL
jgi:Right handed beta helix region/Bacterial TSP3 repeat